MAHMIITVNRDKAENICDNLTKSNEILASNILLKLNFNEVILFFVFRIGFRTQILMSVYLRG